MVRPGSEGAEPASRFWGRRDPGPEPIVARSQEGACRCGGGAPSWPPPRWGARSPGGQQSPRAARGRARAGLRAMAVSRPAGGGLDRVHVFCGSDGAGQQHGFHRKRPRPEDPARIRQVCLVLKWGVHLDSWQPTRHAPVPRARGCSECLPPVVPGMPTVPCEAGAGGGHEGRHPRCQHRAFLPPEPCPTPTRLPGEPALASSSSLACVWLPVLGCAGCPPSLGETWHWLSPAGTFRGPWGHSSGPSAPCVAGEPPPDQPRLPCGTWGVAGWTDGTRGVVGAGKGRP